MENNINLADYFQGCCGALGVPGQGCGAREVERANIGLGFKPDSTTDDGWFGRDQLPRLGLPSTPSFPPLETSSLRATIEGQVQSPTLLLKLPLVAS